MNDGFSNGDLDDDLTTTPQNPPQTATDPASRGGWVMPKPVFRRTSGYLPKGFVKEVEKEIFEDTTAVPNKVLEEAAELAASTKRAASGVAVEPQPEIFEGDLELGDLSTSASPQAKNRGGAGRILMALLILAAIVAVVAIFLFVITYLFFAGRIEGTL